MSRRNSKAVRPTPRGGYSAVACLGTVLRRTALVAGPIALIELAVFVILLHDPLSNWAAYWLYTVVGVIVPGQLVLLRTTGWRTDWLTWVGLGWAVGHGLELLSLLGARALGMPPLFVIWIPIAYGIGLTRIGALEHGFTNMRSAGRTMGAVVVLFCVAAIPYILLNLYTLGPHTGTVSDAWFHVGNAVELRGAGPLTNPRIAGTAFVYHMFAYGPSAAVSLVTGAPVAALLLWYSGLSCVCLVVLLLFNVARHLELGSWLAGSLSVLVFLVPVDVFGLFSDRLSGGSSVVMYGLDVSPTTVGGYMYFAALLLPVLWSTQAGGWREAWVLALLAFSAAGSKSMVGPLLVCGAAALLVWRAVVRRSGDWSSVRLAAVIAVGAVAGSAPVLLSQGGYQDTAHANLGQAAQGMPLDAILMHHPLLHGILLVVFPFAIAPVLIGSAALAVLYPPSGVGVERYLVLVCGIFVAALVPSILLAMPGTSQLFFLYFGLLGLATLSGRGLMIIGRSAVEHPRSAAAALTVAVLLFAVTRERVGGSVAPLLGDSSYSTGLRDLIREGVSGVLTPDAVVPGVGPQLLMTAGVRGGLEWARLHLPGDAVVVTNVVDALPYTALSQTQGWMATDAYTPAAFADDPSAAIARDYGARLELRGRWLGGQTGTLEALRTAGVTDIFVDRINSSVRPPVPGVAIFDDGAFAIYALK